MKINFSSDLFAFDSTVEFEGKLHTFCVQDISRVAWEKPDAVPQDVKYQVSLAVYNEILSASL